MIYELRIYRPLPGQMPKLLDRFEHHTTKIWERLGIRPVGFWVTVIGKSEGSELNYLLAWESLGERGERWAAFQADATWKQVKSGRSFQASGPQSLTLALIAASCTMLMARS